MSLAGPSGLPPTAASSVGTPFRSAAILVEKGGVGTPESALQFASPEAPIGAKWMVGFVVGLCG
jgi:hypothetical protein